VVLYAHIYPYDYLVLIFMYISYSGADSQYASAAESFRHGTKTTVQYTYLGRVIDRDKGIYQNKTRGYFTYDPETNTYGSVPDDFVPPVFKDGRVRAERVLLDFGDTYFLNEVLYKSGMMEVIDSIGYGNSDTLHAMVLFYILSSDANCDAINWYQGNIVKMLYPKANMTSQRISDFLAAIGTPEKQMTFQKTYISYVLKHYSSDQNILIDSSGLPNGNHTWLTAVSNHNGKISNEIRLIFVVQRASGMPLYYQAVPGNIVDVSTLERTLCHLKALGIDISSCIMDAGYNSGDNLDLFYNDDGTLKIEYMTRVKAGDATFKIILEEELATLESGENFVQYANRYLFIKKRKIQAGSDEKKTAWMYLGLDCPRKNDELHKLFKRAENNRLSQDDVYAAMQHQGIFALITGREYTIEELLPAYYQRQSAEQIFDFAKNYTKLLPLRVQSEETFNGHLLLSYIGSCIVKMMQNKLKDADMFMGARFSSLRNQKCTVYSRSLVTSVPQKNASDTYKAFGIKSPASMIIGEDNLLKYSPSEQDPKWSKFMNVSKANKKKDKTKDSGTATENKQKDAEIITKTSDNISDDTGSSQTSAPTGKSAGQPESSELPKTKENKKRGRPKGAKNKKTLEREARLAAEGGESVKRGRGRPKGAKNKKTLEREAKLIAEGVISPPKRKPGRPKGSKNKKKMADVQTDQHSEDLQHRT